MKGMRRTAPLAMAVAALLFLACPARADADDGIVQQDLTPSAARPGVPVTATLTLRASRCTTVERVGVSVRDGLWEDDTLDFPGSVVNARICPSGFTLTTEPRTFRAGSYTQFGYYIDESGYHELTRVKFTVTSMDRSVDPVAGRKPVWAEEFNAPIKWGERWTNTQTGAYAYGTHNPDDGKLDWIEPGNVRVADGVVTLTARPGEHRLENGRRAWDTGLITTEWSQEPLLLRAGDCVETLVRLPATGGAWPALWTWWEDGNEIDMLEYHPDVPDLLEMVNHVRRAGNFHTISPPGENTWTRVVVVLGEESVDWYVDGVLAYQDGHGVGRDWSAHLVMNLSVSAGTWHPAPVTDSPITFSADYVRVYR